MAKRSIRRHHLIYSHKGVGHTHPKFCDTQHTYNPTIHQSSMCQVDCVTVCSWWSRDFGSHLSCILSRWVTAFIYHTVRLIATCSMPGTSIRLHLFHCAVSRAADTVNCQVDRPWLSDCAWKSKLKKEKAEIRQFERCMSWSELAVDTGRCELYSWAYLVAENSVRIVQQGRLRQQVAAACVCQRRIDD